jgi:hypothetical protein
MFTLTIYFFVLNVNVEFVLIYRPHPVQYSSTEFESTLAVYWKGIGVAGISSTEFLIWEFPFLRGMLFRGEDSMCDCVILCCHCRKLCTICIYLYNMYSTYPLDNAHLIFNFLGSLILKFFILFMGETAPCGTALNRKTLSVFSSLFNPPCSLFATCSFYSK